MEPCTQRWKFFHVYFIFSWLFIKYLITARNIERYDTAYECEGKTLKIECRDSELIHLIRANYGRFSITICNEHGNTDWSVNCMSTKSFRVLYSRCNQQQNCSIVASTSQFGDPCPNTLKYLEAHYQCVSAATSSIPRLSPSGLMTSQPPAWSSEKSTTSATITPFPSRFVTMGYDRVTFSKPKEDTSTTVIEENKSSSSEATKNFNGLIKLKESEKIENTEQKESLASTSMSSETDISQKSSTPSIYVQKSFNYTLDGKKNRDLLEPDDEHEFKSRNPPSVKQTNFTCPRQFARKLTWNATHFGQVAVQTCPGGTRGLARWMCVKSNFSDELKIEAKAHWHKSTPDLSECQSVWLSTLSNRIQSGEIILSVSSDLSQVTNNSRELYGGDLLITTNILKNMAQRMANDVLIYQDYRQREVNVAELLQDAVTTGSNLLDQAQSASWKDLNYQEQLLVATSLLQGLEENAFLLANTLTTKKNIIHERTNLLMEIRVLDTQNLEKEFQIFPWGSSKLNKWAKLQDRIELTKNAILGNDNSDGFVRLVFMVFDRLEEILQPQPYDYPSVIQDKLIANLYISSSLNKSYHQDVTRIVNSKVISASLGKGKHIQLTEPVKVYLQHLTLKNVTNPRCVFWDYTASEWSEDGCIIRKSNQTHTICECNHLTNFAVIMDVKSVNKVHQVAMEIVIYIGCFISVISSTLILVIFQLSCNFKTGRAVIHQNICFCLLAAEILYIWISHPLSQKIFCSIITGLLHFLFLSMLAWIFLEGFQLFIMLIEVFEAEKSKPRWYFLAAYGLPFCTVIISSIRDLFGYDTHYFHCWFEVNSFFVFSFIGPVIFVITVNSTFFALATFIMSKHADTTMSVKSKDYLLLSSTRSWLGGSIVFVLLFGLTWLFGFLYLHQKSLTTAYIFTAFNSLQGLFLIVFYCIKNSKTWKDNRKHIWLHFWIPKCAECPRSIESSNYNDSSAANCTKDLTSFNFSPDSPERNNLESFSPRGIRSNLFFKTPSIDSGNKGSEQEESSHVSTNSQLLRIHERRIFSELEVSSRATTSKRANSPYNHTYTEIHDQQQQHHRLHLYHQQHQDDPIYEEIERNVRVHSFEIAHASDISDEDIRRQSDMSRQSSRSYSDHRPLIQNSPGSEFPLSLEKYRRQSCIHLQKPDISEHQLKSKDHTRTIAVLDGHTVVCHLQPQLDLCSSRELPPPSYSEC